MPSHQSLSNWYARLGQHLEAGLLLAEALRLCEGLPQRGRFAMADAMEAGTDFTQILAQAPRWLPKADRQFLLAGMETGSLPQTLKNLSARHANIGATKTKVILGMAYPIAVLHVAALLLPIAQMIDYESGIDWDFRVYLIKTAFLLAPLWSVLAVVAVLARARSPWLHRILRMLPLLRKYSYSQSIADLAYALGTFIAAGVPAPNAWRLAAKMVPDPRFTKAVAELEPVFAAGMDPSVSLKQLKCFPSDFVAFYKTGARSGQLDSNLLMAGRQYQDRANHAMSFAALAYPSVVFLIMAGIVVMTIFQVFGGYLKVFDTLLE